MFFALIFASFLLCQASNPQSIDRNCDLVLRMTDEMGLGVYSGVTLKPNQEIERFPYIPLSKRFMMSSILEDYGEGNNQTHDFIILGYSMLYNHAPTHEGIRIMKFHSTPIYQFKHFPDDSVSAFWRSTGYHFPGDQIFSNYGDEWFSGRPFPETPTRMIPNRDIIHVDDVQGGPDRIPGCSTKLTKFNIEKQRLEAAVDLPEGVVVEVSRALLLPEWLYLNRAGPIEELMWFKPRSMVKLDRERSAHFLNELALSDKNWTFEDRLEGNWREEGEWYPGRLTEEHPDGRYSFIYDDGDSEILSPHQIRKSNKGQVRTHFSSLDYGMLLLGNGALYSHRRTVRMTGDSEEVVEEKPHNIEIAWWFHKRISESATLVPNDEGLVYAGEHYVSDNIDQSCKPCSLQMLISFTTKSFISAGTELIVPLSKSFESGHRFIDDNDFFRTFQCL